jgi:hypothetical protein
VPRKHGRPPVDELTKQVKEQAVARAVAHALDRFGNLESALAHVGAQQESHTGKKMSRSAIIKCFTKRRKMSSNERFPNSRFLEPAISC